MIYEVDRAVCGIHVKGQKNTLGTEETRRCVGVDKNIAAISKDNDSPIFPYTLPGLSGHVAPSRVFTCTHYITYLFLSFSLYSHQSSIYNMLIIFPPASHSGKVIIK